jgi:hypothetical protein
LRFPDNSGKSVKFEMFNSIGKTVYTQTFENIYGSSAPLDFNQFPKGIYFLRLQTENAVYEGKMVIK